MKTFFKILKSILVFCIIFIGILIILFNSTFGNYTSTVYDLFLIPFLFLVYLIKSLIFIFWTKRHRQKKYIILLLSPIIFTILSQLWKQNFHKNISLKAIIEESKGSTITLYDDNTFEIKVQYQHLAEFKKGNYEKIGNKIFLQENTICELTDNLFTQKYYIENNKNIIPVDKNFQPLTILKIKSNF